MDLHNSDQRKTYTTPARGCSPYRARHFAETRRPEEATRLAALKRGEVDIDCSLRGELAEEQRRTPGLAIKPVAVQGTFGVYFADQWDPKAPWHDVRVRRAAGFAIDCNGINDALTMGFSHVIPAADRRGDSKWNASTGGYRA